MPDTVMETHISSLVVYCQAEQLEKITQIINAVKDAEVSLSDPSGKLVVLLESEHEREILNTIKQIETIDGVLSASMVFHQID